jgi:pyridoxamine 5'-phosphate oxidase
MPDASDPLQLDAGEVMPEPLPADPMPLLLEWFARAARERVQPNPDAMALATVDPDGTPSVRMILCKRLDAAGWAQFYTNYDSRKGAALDARPVAAACFHWDRLNLQARLDGPVVRAPAADSDAYFASRPWLSRVGAWASDQSRPIASRADLILKAAHAMRRFGIEPLNPPGEDARVDIPRPPNWGGFRLWARRVELWSGAAGRIHDRAAWERVLTAAGGGFTPGRWAATRLQP